MKIPLPKVQTVYLDTRLEPEAITIEQLGRLHFTKTEITKLEREKRTHNMAWNLIDISTLPVREFGRKATEPRISISESGRFVFNSLIQKQWEDCGKILVQWDEEKRLLAFKAFPLAQEVKTKSGVVPETKFLKIKVGKSDKSFSAGGAAILTLVGYDFASSGNQSLEAKYDEKAKLYILEVPLGALPRREVVKRVKKIKKGANGIPVAPVAPPAKEELLMEV